MIEYSTDHFKGAERFAYWRDVICDAYLPIHCETPDPKAFAGRIALQRYPDLDISRVSGAPQHVSRTRTDIARNSEAFFMVSLQLSRTARLIQDGRTADLRSGDLALYSTTEPYEIVCEGDVDQIVCQIPYDRLLAQVPDAEVLTAMRIDGRSGIGAMVSRNIWQCTQTIAGQNETVRLRLRSLLVDLVATGLSTLSDGTPDLTRGQSLVLHRAKSTVRAHLRDHRLDRAFVAERMGMSPRTLSRCFEQGGLSVAAFIRQSRLEAIADDLRDARMKDASISEIAMKWGMTNFQHLSKLFKQTYGLSPRDYRRTGPER